MPAGMAVVEVPVWAVAVRGVAVWIVIVVPVRGVAVGGLAHKDIASTALTLSIMSAGMAVVEVPYLTKPL